MREGQSMLEAPKLCPEKKKQGSSVSAVQLKDEEGNLTKYNS